ncbi:MAG: STAS domain-containing protein [Candidatus Omnitrophica bacterium]|nr:STAS domain-containing protein [Candidatus Omnitrophota bacterium]MDD5774678.1 STAS domain-containing protein [Candidatus Omnitrophota bacterium]
MDIQMSKQEGVAIVTLSGNLDGNTVNEAQEKIMPILAPDTKSLVLDLKGCGYVSSAGLRLLLMAAKQVSSRGGTLALSGVCDEIKDVMEMTGFSNFFKSFPDINAAVAAVTQGGA